MERREYFGLCVALILVVPSVLTGIGTPHLPLFQRITLAFRIFVRSVSFIALMHSHCLPIPRSFCKLH